MRNLLILIILLAISSSVHAQKEKRILNFDGIDELKLGMTKAEIEKLTGQKITFKHIGIDEQYTESVKVIYKGLPFDLLLMRSEENGARLESVSTGSIMYRTPEGIGIGSDQLTIINTYEDQLLIIGGETITLADINNLHASIVFQMKNNMVVKISVEPTAAFRDRE